jgi:integrase
LYFCRVASKQHIAAHVQNPAHFPRSFKRNPAKYTVRKARLKPTIVCFNPAQAEAFLRAAEKDRLYVMFVIALPLGLRPEEYTDLKWEDIDFDRKTLRVERSAKFNKAVHQKDDKGKFSQNERGRKIKTGGGYYFGKLKTAASYRKLKLSKTRLELLRRQKRAAAALKLRNAKNWQENDLVFPTEAGTPWRQKNLTDRHYLKILKEAGLNDQGFNLYTLRHFHVTLNLLAGVSVNTF